MKVFPEFLKSTLIGGLIFLLPLGIIVFALGELMDMVDGVADNVANTLFPNSDSAFLPSVIAVGLLIAVAFLAGLIARTSIGDGVARKLHGFASANIPGYVFVRQSLSEMSGGANSLAESEELQIAKIDFGSVTRLGIVIDQISPEECVVYIPNAPSVFSGHVAIVRPEQVSYTNLKPTELMSTMRHLGRGLNRAKLT